VATGIRISSLEHPFEDHVVVSVPLSRPAAFAELTRCELEIAEGILAGRTMKELALSRKVSPRTIAQQVAAVHRKLGITSRHELVALVSRSRRTGSAMSTCPDRTHERHKE
jgi:DNA-binding NarL/FixJ family response regulator